MRSAYWRCLISLTAVIACDAFSYLIYKHPAAIKAQATLIICNILIFVSLIFLSKIGRYLGAFLLAASSLYTALAIFTTTHSPPLIVSLPIDGRTLFSLLASYYLVISRSFDKEYAQFRETPPTYLSLASKVLHQLRYPLVSALAFYLLHTTYGDFLDLPQKSSILVEESVQPTAENHSSRGKSK